jgi:ATP synthase protein I
MNAPHQNGDQFAQEIAKQAERRKEGRRRSVWQGLAQVGTVGWMIALPGVGGAFLGRWIDEHYRTGIFWTLSLLIAGLVIGCVAAWRSMNRELRG